MSTNVSSRQKTESELDMWSLYLFSMKSQVTKQKYQRSLEKWLDFIGIKGDSLEAKAKAFTAKGQKDNTWAFNSALSFLRFQKERVDRREVTGATVRNYVKSMKLFCEIADVPIIWSKLTRGLPKGKRYSDDRIPSVDELKKVCEYPDRRIRAIIYTMISSGIRLGSWDYLRWSHIIPIKEGNDIVAAKILVYEGDPEAYFSFVVPSAYNELKKWMDFRAMSGETISGESWVMRDLWDTSVAKGRGMVTMPKKLSSSGIKRLIERAIWAQGLRTQLQIGKKRHPYQAVHSLRKWFKTRCELGGMKPLNIETLLSHSTGISDSYFRPTENELLKDYLGVTASLSLESIDASERNDRLDAVLNRIDVLEKELGIV